MEITNSLVIPPNVAMITAKTIEQAYQFYQGLAIEALEGAVFQNAEEREAEIARMILQLVESTDTINDNVRSRAIAVIAKYRLYHYTPEGWDTIQEMIRDACPSLSAPQMCEHLAIADVIAPYCQAHNIELNMPPDKMGYLREAASALRQVVQGPMDNGQKTATVREELEWIFHEAPTRRAVRERYRNVRGVPAEGGVVETSDGICYIILRATPATAAALRQKVGGLANWNTIRDISVEQDATTAPSKVNQREDVRRHGTTISFRETMIVDAETGEVL